MSNHSNVCRYFASTGKCYYGDQCNFSHIRPDGEQSQTPNNINFKSKSQILCRNVDLHGYCKFQGKGCEYNHDKANNYRRPDETPTLLKRGSSSELPSSFHNLSLKSKSESNAPKTEHHVEFRNDGRPTNVGNTFSPGSAPYLQKNNYRTQTLLPQTVSSPVFVPSSFRNDPQKATNPSQFRTRGGTTYFYPHGQPMVHQQIPAIQYNQNPPSLPHNTKYGRRSLRSFFMPEDLRKEMIQKNAIARGYDEEKAKVLPRTVHRYHSLYPLDEFTPTNIVFGYPTKVFKAISSYDGMAYALRKVEGFRLSNEYALKSGEKWKKINHPNIVTMNEIFISKDFGDNALFFAYDFHPLSETLENKYLKMESEHIPKPTLWSFISQIVSAIRTAHAEGLSIKTILPSKILLTGKNRVRINCCGMHDVINYDVGKNVAQLQQEDLYDLGKLIIFLACKTTTIQNVLKSLEYIEKNYGKDMRDFVFYLLPKPNAMPILNEVIAMLSGRFMIEMEKTERYNDALEGYLSKELENGRLFRLLVKLGFINERPEFEFDPSWSETGDRYLLKLFRDYVFHQVYEDGGPVIDFAHVVECLNKLDVGVHEKIVLMSRDEQSVLVASYKDLKRCTEEAFNELKAASLRKQNLSHFSSRDQDIKKM